MRLCNKTLLASAMLLASVAPVRGGLVTFNFTGSIFGVGNPILGIQPPIGTPVSGSFSYDTSVKGSIQTFPAELIGTYQQSVSAGMRLQIGSFSVSSSNYMVQVTDVTAGNGIDSLMLTSQDVLSVKGSTPDPQAVFKLDFRDFGSKVFQDASLPTNLNLNSFRNSYTYGQIGIRIPPYGIYNPLTFSIDTLNKATTTTTPEPATLILLGIGLAWLLSITVLGTLQVRLKRRAAA